MMFAVFRAGIHIPVPGVDASVIESLFTSGNLFGLLDLFAGGALSKFSIFAMSITPYINASIIMQLLQSVVPQFEAWSKDGEEGRKKIAKVTRYGTVVLGFVQAFGMAFALRANSALVNNDILSVFVVAIILTAGTCLLMWIGEQITAYGIGNGISLIIMIGIIARLPQALIQEFSNRVSEAIGGGIVMLIIEIIILYAVVCAAILLTQGTRKIPVQYAKRVVGNKQYGGARQYIPLKLFAANVMPIIFAQALMFIPLAIVQYSSDSTSSVLQSLMNTKSLAYNCIYVLLIVVFTYFYTAITLNPTQMAEDMKRNNGFIPGVKPGKDTADYIDTVMSRLTGPGALFIAFIAIMPALAGYLNVADAFGQFFGGTSLLILVGVVIDTLQQIESHLMMRHYDGLLNSGHTRGNSGVAAY